MNAAHCSGRSDLASHEELGDAEEVAVLGGGPGDSVAPGCRLVVADRTCGCCHLGALIDVSKPLRPVCSLVHDNDRLHADPREAAVAQERREAAAAPPLDVPIAAEVEDAARQSI
jgi:hypothetical protein